MVGLCGAVVVLGSPWVQERLTAALPTDPVAQGVRGTLATPGWYASSSEAAGLAGRLLWPADLSLVLLLGALVLLVPRVVWRAPGGRVRWAAAVGLCSMAALVDSIVFWSLLPSDAHVFGPRAELLVYSLNDGAPFGVLLGLATGLLWSGTARRPARAAATTRFRHLERSSTIDTLTDSSPTALGREPGDVTRYLCAAAYTDPRFALTVANGVLGDRLGAVAPSPGVDLGPVARHCLAARRLHRDRDLRLTAVVCAILVVAPLWLVLAGAVFGLVGSAASTAPGLRPDRGRSRSRNPVAWWRAVVVYAVVLIAGGRLAVGLSSDGPGALQWLFGTHLFGIPALLVLLAGVPGACLLVADHGLKVEERLRSLRRPDFTPSAAPMPSPVPGWLKDRLRVIDEAQRGNVTVYSGWVPAQGFAARRSSWSLALPVLPAVPPPGAAGGPGEVVPCDAWDLVESLRGHLRELSLLDVAPGVDGSAVLAGLRVEDRIFVHGATIAGDPRFLHDDRLAPAASLDRDQVRRVVLEPNGTARHCLVAHLPLWGGDVVPAVLLHVAVSERTVHVECDVHTLSPVRGGYHGVDNVPDRLTGERRSELLLGAVGRAGQVLRAAPNALVENARFDARRSKREVRELRAIAEDPEFGYGARLSVRESAMNPSYLNYYQVLDAQRVTAALTRHTLTVIREFLDAHGVDTADFQRQQQTILNHGIIQQGGVSVVGNQAVGQEANATQFTQTPAAPAPGA